MGGSTLLPRRDFALQGEPRPSLVPPANPLHTPPFFSHISLSRFALLCLPFRSSTPPSYVCSNNHLLGGGTFEKHLAEHAGNWSPDQDQIFISKALWKTRYTRDTEKTSSNARVAKMNKKNLRSVNIDTTASNHWSKPVSPVKKVKSCTGLICAAH